MNDGHTSSIPALVKAMVETHPQGGELDDHERKIATAALTGAAETIAPFVRELQEKIDRYENTLRCIRAEANDGVGDSHNRLARVVTFVNVTLGTE